MSPASPEGVFVYQHIPKLTILQNVRCSLDVAIAADSAAAAIDCESSAIDGMICTE